MVHFFEDALKLFFEWIENHFPGDEKTFWPWFATQIKFIGRHCNF